MNRGLIWRAVRETRAGTLLFALGLFVFEIVLTAVAPGLLDELGDVMARLQFVRRIVQAILGADVGESIGPGAIRALGWVHPVLLALFWAHAVGFATRTPAAEIDRGTIDVILGLPVSRWQLYRAESLVCVGSAVLLVVATVLGHLAGNLLGDVDRTLPIDQIAAIGVNLLAMYLAVAGLSYLVSACSDRRVRATSVLFAVLLAWMCWQFLGQFWSVAGTLSFLGILDYYRPFLVVQGAGWALVDVAVLLAAGVCPWFAGGLVLARRDVRTL